MTSSSKKSAGKTNLLGKRKVEDGLETKPILRKHKLKETTKGFAELSETKSDEASLITMKETLDETPEEAATVRNKTLIVTNLSPETEISDIINFFKDVGEVVHVQLVVDPYGDLIGYGFVEFASANEAKKALQEKNGKYLHDRQISLDVANRGATPPKYYIDHKVWNEQDYPLPTEEDVEEVTVSKKTLFIINLNPQTDQSDIINFFKDVAQVVYVRFIVDYKGKYGCVKFASVNEAKKAMENKNGEYLHNYKIILLENPDFAEEVLLIANLSSQTTKAKHIVDFFEYVGEVVSVRLVVNLEGKLVGYGFVQFSSSNEAKKALEEMNGEYLHDHQILLMKGLDKTPDFAETVDTVRNKTLFVDNLSPETEMSDIVSFFKDVGQVVHVRLLVDEFGDLKGYGFVGFVSANEAWKALEKHGEYLHDNKIFLDMADPAAYILKRLPMYCIDHKVWYQSYLQSLQEDVSAMEGLEETREEVSVRKKTVFIAKLPREVCSHDTRIIDIINIFKYAGEVVRVRLIVDEWGEHVGCCFVEFASANEAKKAVEMFDGEKFHVNLAELSAPYPFRPKYNLADLAETLWYEDNFIRKNLAKPSTEKSWIKCNTRIPKKQFIGKRTIFGDDE